METAATKRVRMRIGGQVQGVGFRPFVYRLAKGLGLAGWVRNDAAGVVLEVQGVASAIEEMVRRVGAELPPLARVDWLVREEVGVDVGGNSEFRIQSSEVAGTAGGTPAVLTAGVTVDSAVCGECLRELFTAGDRRFGYGLINCTNCGPRFSIIRGIPYDRANTTMAGFVMCAACAGEYGEAGDRRFHAQPVCCPACGPAVRFERSTAAGGTRNDQGSMANDQGGENPYARAAAVLLGGGIVGVKGLGGFHLACRADEEGAVRRLRELKRRESKPLAVMVRDVGAARELVELSEAGARELGGPRAPIVLARKRRSAMANDQWPMTKGAASGGSGAPEWAISNLVAPGTGRLGVMVAYTPVHHLLFRELGDVPLVMTSGNVTDEPIAYENAEAMKRLGPLCDGFLLHDRPIERAVDDSVVMDMEGRVVPVRRSRGYAPVGMRVGGGEVSSFKFQVSSGKALMPGVCVGGELKNTVAVVRAGAAGARGGVEAVLSQHLGDLTNGLAYEHFQRAIEDMVRLFEVRPAWVAHDLHPGYLSTRWARVLAEKWGVPLLGVQHHHAHAAGVLAEHGVLGEAALAVVCDGTGYGTDGTIWGGELLKVEAGGARFERLGHLRPLRLAGGDAAARQTRRPGLALLWAALGEGFWEHAAAVRLVPDAGERGILCAMLRRGVNSPWTSSTGRVFDGVAGLLGVCERNGHEAEAGMRLEMMAEEWEGKMTNDQWPMTKGEGSSFKVQVSRGEAGWFEIGDGQSKGGEAPMTLSVAGLVRAMVEGREERGVEEWAWWLHETLARGFAAMVARAAGATGIRTVGLSGGVFCNAVFTRRLVGYLEAAGMRVLQHEQIPPTDAGLSYGQAVVAGASQRG